MVDAPQTDARRVASDWNRNAGRWSKHLRAGDDRVRDLFTFPAFRERLPNLRNLDVIDFGCGEGTNTRRLAERGARMTGIDLADEMIRHARDAEAASPLGITYVTGSYSDPLSFPDESFDGVVSTMAFMDGPGFDGAMRQAFRILRPSGFVAFSVLHPCFAGNRWQWAKNATGGRVGLVTSGYFDKAGYTDRLHFGANEARSSLDVARFPRSLSDYLNGVAQAGLRITAVDEPRPSEAACEQLPSLKAWREYAALLLIVIAERPG